MQKPPKMKVNLKSIRKDKQLPNMEENMNICDLLEQHTDHIPHIKSDGINSDQSNKSIKGLKHPESKKKINELQNVISPKHKFLYSGIKINKEGKIEGLENTISSFGREDKDLENLLTELKQKVKKKEDSPSDKDNLNNKNSKKK